MLTMWPAAAGSALVFALALEQPGDLAISIESSMAWSMIENLEFARNESLAGNLADGEVLDTTGLPIGSNAKWKLIFATLDAQKFVLIWLDEFDGVAASFENLQEEIAISVQRGSKSKGLWFSGAYRTVNGLPPMVGSIAVPALPAGVSDGTPVAGIILQ